MVTPVGLEPTTFRSGGERSDPLSYGAMARKYSLSEALARLGPKHPSHSHKTGV